MAAQGMDSGGIGWRTAEDGDLESVHQLGEQFRGIALCPVAPRKGTAAATDKGTCLLDSKANMQIIDANSAQRTW